MDIRVTTEEAAEPRALLDSSLADLRFEIAATDNAHLREALHARYGLLAAVLEKLPPSDAPAEEFPSGEVSSALYEEIAHPGG